MPENVTSPSDRKPPRRRHTSGTRPFAFDRHGDIVELDDDCGATVVPTDAYYGRLLALSPRGGR